MRGFLKIFETKSEHYIYKDIMGVLVIQKSLKTCNLTS